MIKEHLKLFRQLMLFTDLCIVAIAFFIAYLIQGQSSDLSSLNIYFKPLAVLLLILGGVFSYFGMYISFRIKSIPEVLFNICKAIFFAFIIFSSVIYVFKFTHFTRTLVILIFILITLFIISERIFIILLFRYVRKRGYNNRCILIVGTGKRAQYFISLINQHTEWGLKIIGLVDEDKAKIGQTIEGYKVIGSFKNMDKVIHNNVIDEVVFVVPRSWLANIEPLIHLVESEGIRINVAVDLFELKVAKSKQTNLHEIPLLTFESTPDKLGQLMLKRMIDIIGSGLGLITLSPFWLIMAVLIKKTSKGPIFFRQERSTLNGRKFTLYKFRTMVEGAEEQLEELKAHNEMQGPAFKMTDDPRLTTAGKFLRKFSLDEFPQLWNVLKGEMSLVGPRPPMPQEVEKYDCRQRRRLSMRAGITCIWQVEGRSKITDFDDWMDMDLKYIDSWSLLLDFTILLKTIPVVLFGIGAK